MASRYTATATVPTGTVVGASGHPLFSDIQRAFPGLAGSASNLLSDYFARHPTLAPPVAQSNVVGADPPTQLFSRFMGLNALTPSFGALSNAPVPPDNQGLPSPVSGTNAVFLAGGLLTALVGGSAAYAASLSIDLISYLDNRRFHLGTGTCAFAVDSSSANALPSAAASITSTSLGTLALSTSSTTSYNTPVVFRCTNFYGNWGTFTITLNLVPAPYVAGPTAVYVGESFCPTTGQWADASGHGYTALVSAGDTAPSTAALWTFNGRAYVTGTTATGVAFPAGVLPSGAYTLFHIARYDGANNQRIVTSSDGTNWLSGHCAGASGVAYHNGWITGSSDAGTSTAWVLSTDQNGLYRCNGMPRTTAGAGSPSTCKLGINTFAGQASDWAVAYVAVYAGTLTAAEVFNVEQALASQYDVAWYYSAIGGTTLGNTDTNSGSCAGSYAVALTGVFQNCSGYAVTSDPQSSASVSGSTLTVTGAFRNTSYVVQTSGTSATGAVALTTFTMQENQHPPWVTGNPGTQVLDSGGSVYVPSYFGGPGLWYGVSGGYAGMSENDANLNAARRNTSYNVTIAAYNQRYDGGNSLGTSTSFTVYENQASPYTIGNPGTQVLDSGGSVYVPSYFGGPGLWYGVSGGYAGMSENDANLNAALAAAEEEAAAAESGSDDAESNDIAGPKKTRRVDRAYQAALDDAIQALRDLPPDALRCSAATAAATMPKSKKSKTAKKDEDVTQQPPSGGLADLSPKFDSIVEALMALSDRAKPVEERGTAIVYSQFRRAEGVAILAVALEANGFVQLELSTTAGGGDRIASLWRGGKLLIGPEITEQVRAAPRYIMYSNDDPELAADLLRVFNDQAGEISSEQLRRSLEALAPSSNGNKALTNLRGQLATAMLITRSGAEGISTKNVRQVHVIEPFWHANRVDQVIGRARRAHSHDALPAEDRTVDVFIYIATFTKEQSKAHGKDAGRTSDEHVHLVAQKKRALLLRLLHAMKRAAVDCAAYGPSSVPEGGCVTAPPGSGPDARMYRIAE